MDFSVDMYDGNKNGDLTEKVDFLFKAFSVLSIERHDKRESSGCCLVCGQRKDLRLAEARLLTTIPDARTMNEILVFTLNKHEHLNVENLKEIIVDLFEQYISSKLMFVGKVNIKLCKSCLVECGDNTHTVCHTCGFHNKYDHEEYYCKNPNLEKFERITIRLKRAGLILDNYETQNGGYIIINPFCFKCNAEKTEELIINSLVYEAS